jgi:DNA-binding Xre family transcriptional regulator
VVAAARHGLVTLVSVLFNRDGHIATEASRAILALARIEVVKIDGERLQRLRKRGIMSRDDLAEKSGIARDHIGRLERGEIPGESRAKTIRALAKALEVEPDELLED